MVATPEGKLSRYFYGVEYAARDLRLGLMESSQSRIGSLADELLLYCYHYDPATGKYGAAVMRVLRIMGVITLLGIIAMIVLLKQRNPQQVGKLTGSAGVRFSKCSRGFHWFLRALPLFRGRSMRCIFIFPALRSSSRC